MRQGGDPRLPLELALVKATRPGSDLSRESLSFRLEQLEQRGHVAAAPAPPPERAERSTPEAPQPAAADVPPPAPKNGLGLEQLQEAWQRTILPAVGERSTPLSAVLAEARPTALDGDTLTLEFPASASFHRGVAEEPKNAAALRDALFDVTGRKLGVVFEVGTGGHVQEGHEDRPVSEDELYELMKETFDAREVGGDE
jgi:hypothetical protein